MWYRLNAPGSCGIAPRTLEGKKTQLDSLDDFPCKMGLGGLPTYVFEKIMEMFFVDIPT